MKNATIKSTKLLGLALGLLANTAYAMNGYIYDDQAAQVTTMYTLTYPQEQQYLQPVSYVAPMNSLDKQYAALGQATYTVLSTFVKLWTDIQNTGNEFGVGGTPSQPATQPVPAASRGLQDISSSIPLFRVVNTSPTVPTFPGALPPTIRPTAGSGVYTSLPSLPTPTGPVRSATPQTPGFPYISPATPPTLLSNGSPVRPVTSLAPTVANFPLPAGFNPRPVSSAVAVTPAVPTGILLSRQ